MANYEYIINLKFVTDGSIDIEVRATGILSTMPIDENVKVPWGTIVGPNVMAAYHQHILGFRIDPAVDGHMNSVVYDDAIKLPRDEFNPYGIGFVTDRHFVEKLVILNKDHLIIELIKSLMKMSLIQYRKLLLVY